MENPNLFKENSATAYNSAAVAAAGGASIPMPTVVIESNSDLLEGNKFLRDLKANTRYILKTDAYIEQASAIPKNVEFVLDGGNLYRYENTEFIPRKITCINGSFIDATTVKGAKPATYIVGARENTSFKNFHELTNYVVEFNMMDFVHSEDYEEMNNAKSINLNNVLERIFSAIYNDEEFLSQDKKTLSQKMVIKMPETYFGKVNFFVKSPIKLKHNVTLDLSGAVVFVPKHFNYESTGDEYEDRCVFSFETNTQHRNLATSIVKNAKIILEENKVSEPDDTATYPKVIFNLTNFSGVLEDVSIDLKNNLECVALWQPYGTPSETYSDRKIIRRCRVYYPGWRTETPTAVFCLGDGCIIEQCLLGYVAILGGRSYTIRGCLNDSYFLYDTTVDFTGSYWEIGQFQILDSKVRFSACRLNCENNSNNLINTAEVMARRYMGPWMAIDTEGCRERLKRMLTELNLGDKNFNDIKVDLGENNANYRKYMAHVAQQASTVTFDPTVRSQQNYWGYRQPMNSPLLKVGDRARIIGLENLESIPTTFINNTVDANKFNSSDYGEVEVDVYKPTTIPLVNGDFFDLKQDIEIPANVEIQAREDSPDPNNAKLLGCDWTNEEFSNIAVRFLLDRDRGLYSSPFVFDKTVTPKKNTELIIVVNADMTYKEYSNLMVELSFTRKVGTIISNYVMRQHFSRPVPADMLSYGDKDVKPKKRGKVEIARFTISKVDTAAFEALRTQKNTEPPTVTTDIAEPASRTLSDYCGNMYNPLSLSLAYFRCKATRLQHIGNNNVRAYVTDIPTMGNWNDGDQVVVPSDTGSNLYVRIDSKWHLL